MQGTDKRRVGIAALVGAAACAILVGLWPSQGPVVFSVVERLWFTAFAGLFGLAVGLIGALAGTLRVDPDRGTLLGLSSLAPAAIVAASLLPREGSVVVQVDPIFIGLWVAGVLVAVALLRTRLAALIALAALTGLAWQVSLPTARTVDRPGIVLVTLDTFRADLLTLDTPHLRDLAESAVRFDAAFAPMPLTGPSHASLFSGLDVVNHGVLVNGQPVAAGLPWVPQILADAGYRTRGYGSAAVLDATLGYDRGFDAFDSSFYSRASRGHPVLALLGREPALGPVFQRPGSVTVALARGVGQPGTFTWIHLYDAHWPYLPSVEARSLTGAPADLRLGDRWRSERHKPGVRQPAPGELEASARALYSAQVADLDAQIGRLLADVPTEATVVLVGDHGESLGEHDYWYQHGALPFAADTQVPLLIRSQGWAPASVSTPVSVTDVGPTLLALAGLPIPEGLDGIALTPQPPDRVISSRSIHFRRPARPEARGDGLDLGRNAGLALRQGSRSLVATSWSDLAAFDRRVDPQEEHGSPVSEDDPLLELFRAALVSDDLAPRPVDDANTREALKALGYID